MKEAIQTMNGENVKKIFKHKVVTNQTGLNQLGVTALHLACTLEVKSHDSDKYIKVTCVICNTVTPQI